MTPPYALRAAKRRLRGEVAAVSCETLLPIAHAANNVKFLLNNVKRRYFRHRRETRGMKAGNALVRHCLGERISCLGDRKNCRPNSVSHMAYAAAGRRGRFSGARGGRRINLSEEQTLWMCCKLSKSIAVCLRHFRPRDGPVDFAAFLAVNESQATFCTLVGQPTRFNPSGLGGCGQVVRHCGLRRGRM